MREEEEYRKDTAQQIKHLNDTNEDMKNAAMSLENWVEKYVPLLI